MNKLRWPISIGLVLLGFCWIIWTNKKKIREKKRGNIIKKKLIKIRKRKIAKFKKNWIRNKDGKNGQNIKRKHEKLSRNFIPNWIKIQRIIKYETIS